MTKTLKSKLRQKMGQLLQQERLNRNETLENVALNVGIKPDVLNRLEQGLGSISLKKYLKLGEYYGKSFEFSLTDNDKI